MLCSAAATLARRKGALALCVTLLTSLTLAASAPVLAQGQPRFVWAPTAFQYDNGAQPSVAVAGPTIVEVHQGEAGALWYHTGEIQPNGTVTWASSAFQYDNGYQPSVAVAGPTIVEVHEADLGVAGPLWYHTGQVQSDGTVRWAPTAFRYDNGALPSVAMSGTTIVEVHQADAPGDVGPLWYHMGQIESNGTVAWAPNAFHYDNGAQPSVALAGSTILEVHQGEAGALWYHTGEIQPDGTVKWASTAFHYDNGFLPSVALSGPTIVEVHQADDGVGPLWYHTGGIQANGTVIWAPTAFQFDTGATPRIALAGPKMINVHQADAGVGLLWYHTGSY
jgi:hypothetical protein